MEQPANQNATPSVLEGTLEMPVVVDGLCYGNFIGKFGLAGNTRASIKFDRREVIGDKQYAPGFVTEFAAQALESIVSSFASDGKVTVSFDSWESTVLWECSDLAQDPTPAMTMCRIVLGIEHRYRHEFTLAVATRALGGESVESDAPKDGVGSW